LLDPTLTRYYDTDSSGNKVFSPARYQYAIDQYARDPSQHGPPQQARLAVDYDF